MRIHLIAIGGSAMHNIALALFENGHQVTGSDDEIYNPARDRLAAAGLLPSQMGWHESHITPAIDLVIVGMHARADNPELRAAQQLGLKVLSYPAFIYEHAKDKLRVVVAGSHGKTTTTAMIMHILRSNFVSFDYLVGAQLDGFSTMVRLSDAPVMVIEGDEYLASAIDRHPKMLYYRPNIAVLTGIAWDHINVFPTFEQYLSQFAEFVRQLQPTDTLYYYIHDTDIAALLPLTSATAIGYDALPFTVADGQATVHYADTEWATPLFGAHNFQNLSAAVQVCAQLGVHKEGIAKAIPTFGGAAKRLQLVAATDAAAVYIDFAHAPSKVKATVAAARSLFPTRKLVAALELHTFSSLSADFHAHYAQSLAQADEAHVFFDPHTLAMKKMPPIDAATLAAHFDHPNLTIHTAATDFWAAMEQTALHQATLLLMSSGNFGGKDLAAWATDKLKAR